MNEGHKHTQKYLKKQAKVFTIVKVKVGNFDSVVLFLDEVLLLIMQRKLDMWNN